MRDGVTAGEVWVISPMKGMAWRLPLGEEYTYENEPDKFVVVDQTHHHRTCCLRVCYMDAMALRRSRISEISSRPCVFYCRCGHCCVRLALVVDTAHWRAHLSSCSLRLVRTAAREYSAAYSPG